MATILVVDDEAAISELVAENLRADGHEVTLAADGQQGIDLLTEVGPDLVILDIMMPRLDGWEVLSIIRQNEQFRGTPVLMLSVKDHPVSKVYGLTHGADDYLTKPFNVEELRARIDLLLRRQAAPTPAAQPPPSERLAEPETIPVQGADGITFLRLDEIAYAKVDHNDCEVHTDGGSFRTRMTLADMEQRLGDERFARCHRSYVVNLKKVKQLIPLAGGNYILSLSDRLQSKIPVSREQGSRIKGLLGI